MNNAPILGGISTFLSGFVTMIQANEILQWIGLAITILCGLTTLAEVIYSWYKKSKADGKITKDEYKELYEELKKKLDKKNKEK